MAIALKDANNQKGIKNVTTSNSSKSSSQASTEGS